MNKKGFTLVELSIVLVIIGLLIGGILAAQSMIQTAKIQSLVRQFGQFDAAVDNFQTKFGQLPGDTSLMGAVPGNNDSIICKYLGGLPYATWTGEPAKFWSDLSISGLTGPNSVSYTDCSAGNCNLSINTASQLPRAAAGQEAYFATAGSGEADAVPGNVSNYYVIGQSFTGTSTSNISSAATFLPTDALAVDTKIDDGNPSNGNIRAVDLLPVLYIDYEDPIKTFGTACTTQAGGTTYKISNSSVACQLAIRIGTSTGDLK